MTRIPPKIKEQLAADPFMKQCCITGDHRAEWHHVWIYGGKQIQEVWAILPLSLRKHRIGAEAFHNGCRETKDLCMFISLCRCRDLGLWPSMLKKYPKKDWKFIFNKLSKKYE